jgi:hypothetical protein
MSQVIVKLVGPAGMRKSALRKLKDGLITAIVGVEGLNLVFSSKDLHVHYVEDGFDKAHRRHKKRKKKDKFRCFGRTRLTITAFVHVISIRKDTPTFQELTVVVKDTVELHLPSCSVKISPLTVEAWLNPPPYDHD